MKYGRPAMLLAMLLVVAHTVSAANPFDASAVVVFINIPLGGDSMTRLPPSFGLDVDTSLNQHRRPALSVAGTPRKQPRAPFEIELTRRGHYRVKVGGFYLDSLN